ncbi:MAG: hypothetical protein VW709_20835 [Rickettsiales bacterium]
MGAPCCGLFSDDRLVAFVLVSPSLSDGLITSEEATGSSMADMALSAGISSSFGSSTPGDFRRNRDIFQSFENGRQNPKKFK